jgi:hypothetical protein
MGQLLLHLHLRIQLSIIKFKSVGVAITAKSIDRPAIAPEFLHIDCKAIIGVSYALLSPTVELVFTVLSDWTCLDAVKVSVALDFPVQ